MTVVFVIVIIIIGSAGSSADRVSMSAFANSDLFSFPKCRIFRNPSVHLQLAASSIFEKDPIFDSEC